jgi:glucose-6-phosphate-specific signal transduction histidine kinase
MTDNFKTLPVEFQSYVNQLSQKLTVIRAEVAANALKAGELMTQRENKRSLALLITATEELLSAPCVLLDSNFLCNSSVSESDALSA